MAIVETKNAIKKEEKIPRAASRDAAQAVLKSPSLKGFAVIETGGKQYKVSSGDILPIEKLSDTHKKGDIVSFDKVLLLSDGEKVTIGDPYIKDVTVKATF